LPLVARLSCYSKNRRLGWLRSDTSALAIRDVN
jgi:hypothetical protein